MPFIVLKKQALFKLGPPRRPAGIQKPLSGLHTSGGHKEKLESAFSRYALKPG